MHFWENHRFNTFVSGDLKGLPEHDPDYAQRMATPLFIFSKSKEGLATWTIWGVPTPPRSTNPLFLMYFSHKTKLGGSFKYFLLKALAQVPYQRESCALPTTWEGWLVWARHG